METSTYTLNVSDVVELERRIAEAGTPLSELMRNAGDAVARAVRDRAPAGGRAVVLAGSGNNGGDGWVTAELLANDGYQATLVTPKAAEEISAEPAHSAALGAMQAAPDLHVLVAPEASPLADALFQADVVVDAVLGTGFSGDTVREPLASWIEAANTARRGGTYVVAADVPSGISAQTGSAASPHIEADETITMMVGKPGLYRGAGRDAAGKVHVAVICDLSPFEPYLAKRAVEA